MAKETLRYFLEEPMPANIEWVQLIRTGKFPYGYEDDFEITPAILREFRLNFDRKARRVELAVDYFHDAYEEAAGWFKELELRENDSQLWVRVDWTEKAKEKILGKEIRYISAEFSLKYKDDETNIEYGATLFGAGLTNRPHVKDMQPMFSEKSKQLNEGKKMINFNEILEAVKNLSEDEKIQLGEKLGFAVKASEELAIKLSEAETAKQLAETNLSAKDKELHKLSEQVREITTKLATTEKSAKFDAMLAQGKAVPAQKDAFMAGDMIKFAENAVAGINLSANGSGEDSEEGEVKTAAVQFDEKCQVLVKEKGITYSEASKQVARENAVLLAKINATN